MNVSDDFPSAKDTLFGENLPYALTKGVEKDPALSKSVSITEKKERGFTLYLPEGGAKKGFEGGLL